MRRPCDTITSVAGLGIDVKAYIAYWVQTKETDGLPVQEDERGKFIEFSTIEELESVTSQFDVMLRRITYDLHLTDKQKNRVKPEDRFEPWYQLMLDVRGGRFRQR